MPVKGIDSFNWIYVISRTNRRSIIGYKFRKGVLAFAFLRFKIHFPLVKSGNATGAPPCEIDISESAVTAIQVAVS